VTDDYAGVISGTFSAAASYPIIAMVELVGELGSGGGSVSTPVTPTIRGTTIQWANSASYTVTIPAGSIAGDVMFIYMGHGFSPQTPTGWLPVLLQLGTNAQGGIFAKTLTSANITTGTVTVTASGGFNGLVMSVVIVGTTLGKTRIARGVQSGTGTTSTSVHFPETEIGDLIIVFAYTRGNATSGLTNTTQVRTNAIDTASGSLFTATAVQNVFGFLETLTFSGAGNGYHWGAISLRGV
jgi:hypothetical protein